MTTIRWTACLAVPLLCLPAGAALGHPENGPYRLLTIADDASVLIDEASLERDGDVRAFWTLSIPLRTTSAHVSIPTMAYYRTQWRVECGRRMVQVRRIMFYDAAGRVIENSRNPAGGPRAMQEGRTHPLIGYVCNGIVPERTASRGTATLAQVLEAARQVREETRDPPADR